MVLLELLYMCYGRRRDVMNSSGLSKCCFFFRLCREFVFIFHERLWKT